MKVGYFQFNPIWGMPEENRGRILSKLDEIAPQALDLVVLPELAFSGYLFSKREELLAFSQTAQDRFFYPLQEMCDRKNWAIVCGFIEKEDTGGTFEASSSQRSNDFEFHRHSQLYRLYNSAIVLRPYEKSIIYRKNHLYDREKLFFSSGDKGFPTFNFKGACCGVLICFDHMFPEAARSLALQGVQIICHPSNLVLPGYAQITSCARALENRVYWILANRYGTERLGLNYDEEDEQKILQTQLADSSDDISLTFSGKSRIVSPYGEVLNEASATSELLSIVDIDPQSCSDKTLGTRNDLFKDRRHYIYDL